MKINEYYYQLRGSDDFVTRNHTHSEIELIECVRGSGTVLKSDRSYPLKDRFLYIIDARRPHIVYPTDCSHYIRNKIVIDAKSFYAFLREAGLHEHISILLDAPPVSTANHPEIDRIFETVSTLCRSGRAENTGFAHGYILQLLHFAAEHGTCAAPAPTNDFIEQALSLIAQTDGMTSLEEISRRLNLSKYYLCHLFKQRTGITVSEYIAEKRYEKSLRLLRSTALSIEEIASRCGFSSGSAFTRFFRKRHGLPPNTWRKNGVH